ncbi:10389_t:CDS:1, partial [Funneliformis mosseae]
FAKIESNVRNPSKCDRIRASTNLAPRYTNIVDTSGIFDTDKPNEEILEEIAHTVQKCAYGIKAILFVL